MIACLDAENGIGKDGKLLCHLPSDLRHFKETTQGHICVFGRKTYESLPKRPLPKRKTIVLTNDKDYIDTDIKVVHSIDDVLRMSAKNEIFICGGGFLYEQFYEFTDKMILTVVDKSFGADTFFPDIRGEWRVKIKSKHTNDDGLLYYISEYTREWRRHK
jgi:dihydrofolate reductase